MRRLLAVTLALIALPVPAARAADGETRIVVGRDPGLSGAQKAEIRHDAGVRLEQTLRIPDAEVVTAPAGGAGGALRELRADPSVRWAQIDHVRHIDTSDTYFSQQWALAGTAIDATGAWADGAFGSGVMVGIVDTGVDLTHPDLVGRLAPPADWKDFVAGNATPQDENGHGTHVAGIVAATSDNGIGVAGVAPQATIMPVRVMDASGAGYDSVIANGLDWAAAHGAKIVNASLGGSQPAPAIDAAIEAHPDTLFVVAAGNAGIDDDTTPEYPCALPEPNIICVGASDQSDAPATEGTAGSSSYWASNYGPHTVDLFAPGAGIASTWVDASTTPPTHTYAFDSGTSMAAPQVSGVAALMVGQAVATWSRDTGAQLAAGLRSSVDPIPALAGLSVTGGRIDALKALGVSPPAPVIAPPTPTPAPATPRKVASTPPPASDRDGDGRPDATDACPTEAAATLDGCPLPRVRSLRVRVARHHRVSARVRTDRAATIAVRIDRRSCRAHHRCRYRRVATRTASGRRATLARRLSPGRYRVTVLLTSAAGRGATVRRSLRVH